jgi:hypothetical protein
MKINRKEVLEFARKNMQYDTDNPFEATIRAVETWMGKNNLKIMSFQEVLEVRIDGMIDGKKECLVGVEGEAKNDPD